MRPSLEAAGPAAVALLAGGFFLLYEHQAGVLGFALDDAWIHLQFARNLAGGHGFSFNAGEAAAGSTAPLWTLSLAFFQALWADPVLAVKCWGIALHGLSAALSVWLARLCGAGRWGALAAGTAVALTPRLLWGAVSGMEIPLYTALATAGLALHLARWDQRASPWGAVLLALASLARPECLLLYPLVLVDRWRRWGRSAWHSGEALLFAAVLAPAAAFNLATIGKVLPNTFYAKVGPYGLLGALGAGDWSRVAKVLAYYPLVQLEDLGRFAVENSAVLALGIPLGLVYMLRASGRGVPSAWIVPLVLLAYPLARGVLAPFKGPTFQHGRYAAHLVPLLSVVAVVGFKQGFELLCAERSAPLAQGIRRWGSWILVAVAAAGLLGQDLRYAALQARNVAEINRMHVQIGRWLNEHTPAGAVVATHDIGALGYFSGRRIVDTAGLVTPAVLDFLQPGVEADAGVLRFLQQERPDFLVVIPTWYPRLVEETRFFKPIHQVRLAENTIAAGDRMVVFECRF